LQNRDKNICKKIMLSFLVSDRTESFGEHDLSILFYASFFCLVYGLCRIGVVVVPVSRCCQGCPHDTDVGRSPASSMDLSQKVWLEKSSSGLGCSHFFASGSTRATRVVVKSMFRYVRGLIGTS
jgi:hypothetical protein